MHFEQVKDRENTFQLNMELDFFPEEPLLLNEFYKIREENLDSFEISIPCNIFGEGLSGLEAIVKYLKDIKELSYSEISKILNRDPRTIWTTYNKIKNKKIRKTQNINKYNFSTRIIRNRELSVLESVSLFLRKKGLTIKEISIELSRNNKTIWTALNRAEKKIKQSEVRA
jgi:DNA-directed RNA polymerase specialized sigma24 family protein